MATLTSMNSDESKVYYHRGSGKSHQSSRETPSAKDKWIAVGPAPPNLLTADGHSVESFYSPTAKESSLKTFKLAHISHLKLNVAILRQILFCLFGVIVLTSSLAHAKVQIAFFEKRNARGELTPIEPGGHLWHLAIQNQGQWMHAHPFFGVIEADDVRKVGQLFSVIEIDQDIPRERYEAERGKKFSMTDPWHSSETTYCSKLVAKILGIPPQPMLNEEGLGISPDDLYKILKAQPHREIRTCSGLFLVL